MSLPDESSRVAASSLLARLGIIVVELEFKYPMHWATINDPRKAYLYDAYVPALETARKFNSSSWSARCALRRARICCANSSNFSAH